MIDNTDRNDPIKALNDFEAQMLAEFAAVASMSRRERRRLIKFATDTTPLPPGVRRLDVLSQEIRRLQNSK